MVHDSVNYVPMWSIQTIDEDFDVYRMYGLHDLVIRKPDGDFDTGMHALGNDPDVRKLAEYVTLGNKMIEVYIEHESTTLHTYYMTHEDADFSTPKCVIQEIEDDVMPEMQATKLKPWKRVKGQHDMKLMLEWIVEPNGVLETFKQDEIARGGGNENKTNNVTDVEEGSDRGQGSDRESSDGNDSDELVDDENAVEHVHVDMDTLDKSNANTLGVDDKHGEFNANEEIDVDLDVIDNKEFESASDEDGLDRVRQRKLKL
ncbi:hypothetical protein Tco_1375801 [Tanacetum coccineum]